MCLMSLSTPSAAGPCQCGHVAGQRHLYLKDQQDTNADNLRFEEPLPETTPQILSALLKAENLPTQIKVMQTRHRQRVFLKQKVLC